MTVGFIPVRSGSKGIPGKNWKDFCGKPLFRWQVDAMISSGVFDQVWVSTDSLEIKTIITDNYSGVKVHHRSKGVSQDISSTEDTMIEFICDTNLDENTVFVLGQATNPFIQDEDYSKAVIKYKEYLNKSSNVSMLSVCEANRFFWEKSVNSFIAPINYNLFNRARRQDYVAEFFIENGGFYISTVRNILTYKNRITQSALFYKMPEHTRYEIDTLLDWKICELVFKEKLLLS